MSFDLGNSSHKVDIVSYDWDFGDETTGTGLTINHTYTVDYTVTLTMKDAMGNKDTDSITITVLRDTDGDGLINLQEYLGGTDPNNPFSPLPWWVPVAVTGFGGFGAAIAFYFLKVRKL